MTHEQARDRQGGVLRTLALVLGMLAVRFPRLVLAATLVVTLGLGAAATRIDQDDDVTRFLPGDDPEVERFQAIGRRFGGLSIAIVGLEVAPDGGDGDLFTVERLRLLRELDAALAAVPGVNATTSFTELPDIIESQAEDGRSRADLHDLVGNLPPPDAPAAARAAFADDVRSRAMAREHIVGALVSDDGAATILLCQLDPDAPMKPTADALRAATERLLAEHDGAGLRAHFGGAPFIGSYAAENTRRDLIALSPWVIAAVVLVMLVTSRSLPAVAIALFTVGAGIAQVMGGLVLLGRDLTLVSSSLPVLLVALGSAYAIHLLAATLSALDRHTGRADRAARVDAVHEALRESGPPILVAGLTTVAGFASFLVMDVAPMREFGVLMALATLLIVVVTLLVVPAASVLLPLRARAEGRAPAWALAAMTSAARTVTRHRTAALLVLLAVGAVAAVGATRVRAHTDIRTLFAEDSEPVRAERFLEERFGGSLFLQIEVAGDIKSPAVLRQVERIAASVAGIDGVSRVQSVVTAVNLASWATTGEPRVPPRRETAAALGELVLSDPSARLLVDEPWQHTLLQVQLSTFDISRAREIAAEIAERTEPLAGRRVGVVRGELSPATELHALDEVLDHVASVLVAEGLEPPPREALREALSAGALKGLRDEVTAELRYNLVDDPMVTLADPGALETVVGLVMAQIAAGGFNDPTQFATMLGEHVAPGERANPESLREGTDFVFAAVKDIVDRRLRSDRTAAVLALVGERLGPQGPSPRLRSALERALWTLADEVAFVPAAVVQAGDAPAGESGELAVVVSGYPLMYAAMNDSVERNQWGSLLTSAVLVALALALFYRSLVMAAVALVPAVFTLLVTFGAMGFLKIPMDVGTSMIAAIALGVGIDYAVHLLWRYGRPAESEAEGRLGEALGATGWGIVINALEVSVGLIILTFGTIVPMRNFGLLSATAMLVGAACTLALVPALAVRRRRAS